MPDMECPSCGCKAFYIKDPEDEYEIHEFESQNGEAVFSADAKGAVSPEVVADTEIYCNKCAWHGKLLTCQKA